ncbi:MAG: glutamate--tRNA ligase [Rickettsiales bacterium]|nr:glutamate--tRNA ligase [Rickettsiales bacterium]
MRTALINWLLARKLDGRFLLRIDDTDQERSEEKYVAGIEEDLQWLGLQWDERAKQSDYFDAYEQAKQKLIADGRLYPCYETPEELEIKRKMLASRGLPPIYDRSALKLSDAQIAAYEAEGRTPHWRFKLEHAPIEWEDLIRGTVHFEGQNLADPVLIRADGVPLFTLSTSVDDGSMGITHIMRGEDHVSNTAIQVQIMEALGYDVPIFGHTALLQMKGGKLSKREGGGDIRSLREEGLFPEVINSYLATIGTSDPIALFESIDDLVTNFETSKFGRAMANYDPEELQRLNEKLLHTLPYTSVKEQLASQGLNDVDEDFWEQVKSNVSALPQVKDWWEMLRQPISPVIEDADFTNQAATLLPDGDWSEESWNQFVDAVKNETGRKGKQLFMPLRLALTGRTDGPELPKIFALLGRDKAKARLLGEAA